MASSSRPFRSQTINHLLGTYYAWSQKFSRAMGWLRVGVVWAAQVALYPVYAVFQGSRVIYRRVVAADPVGQVMALIKPKPSPIRVWLQAKQSDGAIQVLLGWLQQPASPLFEGYLPPAPLQGRARVLQGDQALLPLNLQGISARFRNIQGIATNLETQALVLVGRDNQLLDVLSLEEQAVLDRAIRWLLSEQSYQSWRQRQQRTVGRLPLPIPNRRAWWPIQLFQHLMRWMNTSSVAVFTNLFGEVELVTDLRNNRLLHKQFPSQQALLGQNSSGAILPVVSQATAIIEAAPPALDLAKNVMPVAKRQTNQDLADSKSGGLAPTSLAISQLKEEPAWIEAEATVVSYIQHPLVTVLRWIDLVLSQMEKFLHDGWQWVRSHITF